MGGSLQYHSICFHQSALLVLNALLNNVSALIRLLGWANFQINQKDISASCYTHSLRFLTWVNQQARTCPSFQITQAHTHMYALTLKAPIKWSTCVIFLFPAHEPYRWPIRVKIGSFHTIYMNIKHPCMGNTEPKLKTFLNVFRYTFSIVLSTPAKRFVSSVYHL